MNLIYMHKNPFQLSRSTGLQVLCAVLLGTISTCPAYALPVRSVHTERASDSDKVVILFAGFASSSAYFHTKIIPSLQGRGIACLNGTARSLGKPHRTLMGILSSSRHVARLSLLGFFQGLLEPRTILYKLRGWLSTARAGTRKDAPFWNWGFEGVQERAGAVEQTLRCQLQGKKIILLGFSQGGLTALKFWELFRHRYNIRGIITIAAPLQGASFIRHIQSSTYMAQVARRYASGYWNW